MFRNYLIVAVRNLRKRKIFSAINIIGLAVGIAVFFLIFEYVAAEWNSNRFNKNFDRLYRLGAVDTKGKEESYIAPGFTYPLKQQIGGIEAITRVTDDLGSGVASLPADNKGTIKSFREEHICYADSNFFRIFSFPLVAGQASLANPNAVLLSSATAQKFFGTTRATGKTITISNQFGKSDFTVSGVFDDKADQSDIKLSIVLSMEYLAIAANRHGNDWADPATLENSFVSCFVVLRPSVRPEQVRMAMEDFAHRMSPTTAGTKVVLQPFSALHLAPDFSYPHPTFGSLKLVTMLLSVAILILLIAWINYINLSTVQGITRSRETGVRKVLGASRSQLRWQFMAETFLLTAIAAAVAIVLLQLLQGLFNTFTGKQLSAGQIESGWFWPAAMAFVVLGAIGSGAYVSMVMSSYSPALALKPGITPTSSRSTLRRGLVVFQFAVSIIFIVSTFVLYRQLQYMKNSRLGMDLSQVLVVRGPNVTGPGQGARNSAFMGELGQLSFVQKLAASNNVPGRGYNFSVDHVTRMPGQRGDDKKSYRMFITDERYFDTYAISFLSGNVYNREQVQLGWSKSRKIVLNRRAAEAIGFNPAASATGQQVNWAGDTYQVSGVVENYHHLSLQNSIDPVIFLPLAASGYYSIKTTTDQLPAKIDRIRQLYNHYFNGNPFEYFFAADDFNRQYTTEQQLGNVFIIAAVLAIIIACLGLFGLAAFTARQRTREIGIRKVLGAGIGDIVALLSYDFVKLVLLAIVIAVPLAAWAGHSWLQQFAYHAALPWWIFAAAGSAALLIAVITVSFQAISAAVVNPVSSLKSD